MKLHRACWFEPVASAGSPDLTDYRPVDASPREMVKMKCEAAIRQPIPNPCQD